LPWRRHVRTRQDLRDHAIEQFLNCASGQPCWGDAQGPCGGWAASLTGAVALFLKVYFKGRANMLKKQTKEHGNPPI
jgi:hypothetical protein